MKVAFILNCQEKISIKGAVTRISSNFNSFRPLCNLSVFYLCGLLRHLSNWQACYEDCKGWFPLAENCCSKNFATKTIIFSTEKSSSVENVSQPKLTNYSIQKVKISLYPVVNPSNKLYHNVYHIMTRVTLGVETFAWRNFRAFRGFELDPRKLIHAKKSKFRDPRKLIQAKKSQFRDPRKLIHAKKVNFVIREC